MLSFDLPLIPDSSTPLAHNYTQGNTGGCLKFDWGLAVRQKQRLRCAYPDSHPDAGLHRQEAGIEDEQWVVVCSQSGLLFLWEVPMVHDHSLQYPAIKLFLQIVFNVFTGKKTKHLRKSGHKIMLSHARVNFLVKIQLQKPAHNN